MEQLSFSINSVCVVSTPSPASQMDSIKPPPISNTHVRTLLHMLVITRNNFIIPCFQQGEEQLFIAGQNIQSLLFAVEASLCVGSRGRQRRAVQRLITWHAKCIKFCRHFNSNMLDSWVSPEAAGFFYLLHRRSKPFPGYSSFCSSSLLCF